MPNRLGGFRRPSKIQTRTQDGELLCVVSAKEGEDGHDSRIQTGGAPPGRRYLPRRARCSAIALRLPLRGRGSDGPLITAKSGCDR
jgi:hypothetical protein